MNAPRARWIAAAAIALFIMLPPLGAQEDASGEGRATKPPWIPADLPPEDYAVGDPPPPVERVFRKRPSRVWKKLVRVLEEEGLVTSTLDRESGSIQTELKIFDEVKGPFKNVATRPPTASRQRPIRQWVILNRGRYSLDISVKPDERTRVSIKAYIEERAFHVGENVRIWAERYSNGTIENYFLDRLEQAL